MAIGRPIKYGEKTHLEHFAMPLSVVNYLNELSAEKNMSKTELVINALVYTDRDMLAKFSQDIKTIRDSQNKIMQENKELQDKLNKSTISYLYSQVKEDKHLNEFLTYFYNAHKKWVMAGISDNELLNEYELWLYDQYHLTIKNKTHIKIALKSWIEKVYQSKLR